MKSVLGKEYEMEMRHSFCKDMAAKLPRIDCVDLAAHPVKPVDEGPYPAPVVVVGRRHLCTIRQSAKRAATLRVIEFGNAPLHF